MSTGSTSTSAAPTAKDGQKAADPAVDGQRKKQQAADQRLRKRCKTIERSKLEEAVRTKSDADLLRVFAKMNKAGQDDTRRWRANNAVSTFVRIRWNARGYDYVCLGCRRVRDKQKCNCARWTGSQPTEQTTHSIVTAPVTAPTTRQSWAAHEVELGGVEWAEDVDVVTAFVSYLEVHHEGTLASYTKRFTEYVRWHRNGRPSASSETPRASSETMAPFPQELVASHLATEYMAGLKETAREAFTSLHVLICRWIASFDPQRFLQAADDLSKAQQKKRQKRQTKARRLKATLPEGLVTTEACSAFRRKVVTSLAANLGNVTSRLHAGKSTPADRMYMSMLVPTVLEVEGKPMRPCDIAAISLEQAATLQEGKPLVVEEQKRSCANTFTYIPSSTCVRRCLEVYTKTFRPFLASDGGHAYQKPAVQATDSDVAHVASVLRAVNREQMVNRASSKRAQSKYAWILNNRPPASGWSTGALTGDDLRVA